MAAATEWLNIAARCNLLPSAIPKLITYARVLPAVKRERSDHHVAVPAFPASLPVALALLGSPNDVGGK
jgi:hypothetical protein